MASFEQLRILITVAGSTSFTAAARQLDRSQGAISQAIQTLELDLGFELFDRQGPKPQLTLRGKQFCDRACQVLNQVEQLHALSQRPIGETERSLNIGLGGMVPLQLVQQPLQEFSHHFPEVEVSIIRDQFGRLKQRLLAGELQLLMHFTCGYELTSAFEAHTLTEVTFCWICSPDHPLATGAPIEYQQLLAYRQICCEAMLQNPITHMTATASYDTWLADDQDDMLRLVEQGLGWAILPIELYNERQALGVLHRFRPEFMHCDVSFAVDMIRSTRRVPGPAQCCLEAMLKQQSRSSTTSKTE